MSADNGVYILKTLDPNLPHTYEFRVADLQAIENVDYDEVGMCSTNDDDIRIKNARRMWEGCKVYKDINEVYAVAMDMARRGYYEYGVCEIWIERVF